MKTMGRKAIPRMLGLRWDHVHQTGEDPPFLRTPDDPRWEGPE